MTDLIECYICHGLATSINADEKPVCPYCAKLPTETLDTDRLLRKIGEDYRAMPEYKAAKQKERVERRQEAVIFGVCIVLGLWLAMALLVGSVHMAQYILRAGR